MSLTASAIRMLAEKGLSALDIAEIAEANEPKRTAGADRQKRYRDNKRDVTRNVTPPNDIYSNPPEITPKTTNVVFPPKPKQPRSSKLGEPLPDDWQPILTEAAQKIADEWPPGWVDEQVTGFRDHARDKARRSKDWQAAFRTWISKANEWGRQKNGRNGTQANRAGGDGLTRVLDRDIARIYEDERNGTGGNSGGGQAPLAFLDDMRR